MTAEEEAMSLPSAKFGSGVFWFTGIDDLGELILQVQDLRQRVLNLEQRLGIRCTVAPGAEGACLRPPPIFRPDRLPPNTVPVLGRMLVAIAGAYVLRALTDWGCCPQPPAWPSA
jgi:hypothetical protein